MNQCHKREQRRQGLSSAGEEYFTDCMDCFRQWTHICTEDREKSPDVEPWGQKPQDTEHGGNGTSVPSSQEGQLSEGSEEIEAGKEKPEPMIPSTSAEEADTQTTM